MWLWNHFSLAAECLLHLPESSKSRFFIAIPKRYMAVRSRPIVRRIAWPERRRTVLKPVGGEAPDLTTGFESAALAARRTNLAPVWGCLRPKLVRTLRIRAGIPFRNEISLHRGHARAGKTRICRGKRSCLFQSPESIDTNPAQSG